MQRKPRVRKRFTPGQRKAFVQAYRKSSLSQRRFAAQAGISISALQLWGRQLAAPKTVASAMVQLPNPLAGSPERCRCRVRLSNGITVELLDHFEAAQLDCLLKAAASL